MKVLNYNIIALLIKKDIDRLSGLGIKPIHNVILKYITNPKLVLLYIQYREIE